MAVDPSAALPSAGLVWRCFAAVALTAIASAALFVITDPNLHLNLTDFVVLAPIFFAAQAIERLLEPIAARYNPPEGEEAAVKEAREQKIRAQDAVAAAISANPTQPLDQATAAPTALEETLNTASENEQAAELALRKKRAERKIVWWTAATVISLLLCGALGLGILEAMSTQDLEEYLGAIDIVLTGLVIGAGTKPLHDLIARLEKSKDNADPATNPTVPASTTTTPSAGASGSAASTGAGQSS
jgi:hypothetical protein